MHRDTSTLRFKRVSVSVCALGTPRRMLENVVQGLEPSRMARFASRCNRGAAEADAIVKQQLQLGSRHSTQLEAAEADAIGEQR